MIEIMDRFELGKKLCKILGVEDKRVSSINIYMKAGEPLVATIQTFVANDEGIEFLEIIKKSVWIEDKE